MIISRSLIAAALFVGAVVLSPLSVRAGSCCGGGGGATLVLPKFYQSMVDVSFDVEKYYGFWNQKKEYKQDSGDLRQYRLNTGYAKRLSTNWQASVLVPYVWNVNKYESGSRREDGIGDTTLSFWYEALDDTSAWKLRDLKGLIPSITIGPSLVIPTGISPYDGVPSDDVTGRGFYRLDGNIIISKTLHPWGVSISGGYGSYLERSVNREENYITPYRKKLGDRSSASISLSYIYYFGSGGDTLTGTGSLSKLCEANATMNGNQISNSGFQKESIGGTIAYSSTDHDWGVRATWNHTVKRDGWGENFPATDIYTIGVNYGFRK